MTQQILLDLADRCEREEPSSTLDRAIWCEINHEAFAYALQRSSEEIARARGNGLTNRDDACVRYAFMSCPRYTTSLDAAVTIVPENASWSLEVRGGCEAEVTLPVGRFLVQGDIERFGRSGVPAKALCAAALRACAASEGENCGERSAQ